MHKEEREIKKEACLCCLRKQIKNVKLVQDRKLKKKLKLHDMFSIPREKAYPH